MTTQDYATNRRVLAHAAISHAVEGSAVARAELARLRKVEAAARHLMEGRYHTPTTYAAAMDALRDALGGED